MDQEKIRHGVALILEGIGEDTTRKGLQRTPERVAAMCLEIFDGIGTVPHIESAFVEEAAAGDRISLRRIDFYSMCEHHLLPFFGSVDISYRPHRHIAGFSAFSRVVDQLARRPQIQERFTAQIADAIMDSLQPYGVRVSSKATQLCTCMRGVHRKRMTTVCEAVRGDWSDNDLSSDS